MKEKEINCYFCGNEAIQTEGGEYDTSRNVKVECDLCKVYALTLEVLQKYYDENLSSLSYSDENTGERKELPQELKDKLSEYVRNKFDPETGDPVLIRTIEFQAVTGKNSVHII